MICGFGVVGVRRNCIVHQEATAECSFIHSFKNSPNEWYIYRLRIRIVTMNNWIKQSNSRMRIGSEMGQGGGWPLGQEPIEVHSLNSNHDWYKRITSIFGKPGMFLCKEYRENQHAVLFDRNSLSHWTFVPDTLEQYLPLNDCPLRLYQCHSEIGMIMPTR